MPIRARLRHPADRQVPQLGRPVVGRQLVKERFAQVLVDSIELYRQPGDARRLPVVAGKDVAAAAIAFGDIHGLIRGPDQRI